MDLAIKDTIFTPFYRLHCVWTGRDRKGNRNKLAKNLSVSFLKLAWFVKLEGIPRIYWINGQTLKGKVPLIPTERFRFCFLKVLPGVSSTICLGKNQTSKYPYTSQHIPKIAIRTETRKYCTHGCSVLYLWTFPIKATTMNNINI